MASHSVWMRRGSLWLAFAGSASGCPEDTASQGESTGPTTSSGTGGTTAVEPDTDTDPTGPSAGELESAGSTEGADSLASEGSGTGSGESGENDTASTGEDQGGTPPDEAIRQFIAARCSWLFSCCGTGELRLELGPFTASEDECVARVMGVLESGGSTPPVEAGPSALLLPLTQAYAQGRITFDPDAVATCVTSLLDAPCNAYAEPATRCEPTDLQPEVPPCALERLTQGQQSVGDPCDPLIGNECADGSRCILAGADGVCVALAGTDVPCFADTDCAAPLICDLASSGTCRPGRAEGEACAFADPENPLPGTETERCEPGLVCNPTNLSCSGRTCDLGTTCTSDLQCPADLYCIEGSCLPPRAGGEPCTSSAHCVSTYCSGVCSEPNQPNDSFCVVHGECASGWCMWTSQTCSDPPDVGDPCVSTTDCAEGYCNTALEVPVCAAYAGDGDPCVTVADCDPELLLQCIDATCRKLANGETCYSSIHCESELCYLGYCAAPLALDEACGATSGNLPCVVDTYCDLPVGQVDGTCRPLLASGEPCRDSAQCQGACVEVWGQDLCDATPAPLAAWCDGT